MKDLWNEKLQNQKNGKKIKRGILIVLLLIVCLISIAMYLYNEEFQKWCDENVLHIQLSQQNTKFIEYDSDENSQIYAYDKYICIFRKKNLEFYNKVGQKVSEIELDINKANFTSCGRYLAVSEENGQKFYLICDREKVYENKIEGDIKQIHVSRSGFVSIAISNTNYKAIVGVYNRSGKEIFKTNLVSSRITDISISQDNKYLAIAEVDLSGIIISSKIQIVSIELAQTSPEQAILYKYEAPTNKLIMNIEYQEKNNLLCMYNDSIEVLQEETSNPIFKLENSKIAFSSIELSNRIAILEEVSTGKYTADTKTRIINPETLKEQEYIAKDVVKSINTSQNKIAINFGTELHIINTKGRVLKKYTSNTDINDIVMSEGIIGVIHKDKIQIINL